MSKIILQIIEWIRKTFFETDILPPAPQPIPTPPTPPPAPAPTPLTIKEIVIQTCAEQKIEPELGVAVASCEGGLTNARAINKNTNGSIDRGIFQWNNKVFPQITDAEAFDPKQATILFCQAVRAGCLHTYWHLSEPNWKKLVSQATLKKYGIT